MRKISIVTALMVCGFLVGINEWRNIDGLRIPALNAQSSKPVASLSSERTSHNDRLNGRAKIETMLNKPLELQFDQVPMQKAFDKLAQHYGIAIIFDPRIRGEIDLEDPISLSFESETIPLKTALHDLILSPRDLAYRVREGYLMITTYDEYIEFGHEIAVYDCRDLISKPGEMGDCKLQQQARRKKLIKIIDKLIGPPGTPWDDNVGVEDIWEVIEPFENHLVIWAIPHDHEKVKDLLQKLRDAMKE